MFFVCLAVAVLAVARVTRLLTEDRLALAYRRWVVRRYGEESLPAYLAHCPWCTSIYVAAVVMPLTVYLAPGWTEGWGAKLLLSALLVPATSLLASLVLDRK